MPIDLDTLNPKIRVQKSETTGYMSILHAVPMQPKVKVQKSAAPKTANKPKQPTRKAVPPQPYKPTPESLPGSTIGNTGHPNAASNVSGEPVATAKPSGIESVLASTIEALTAAVKAINIPKPSPANTVNMDAVLRASRAEDDAATWNESRSAAQRADFLFKAAKMDNSRVNLGVSAHAVRMNGNVLAPAPVTARKSAERRQWFSDTYMARLGKK